jgi:hypothetical protein
VERIFQLIVSLKHRAILMTAYGAASTLGRNDPGLLA